jgi:hypothetical protein
MRRELSAAVLLVEKESKYWHQPKHAEKRNPDISRLNAASKTISFNNLSKR